MSITEMRSVLNATEEEGEEKKYEAEKESNEEPEEHGDLDT